MARDKEEKRSFRKSEVPKYVFPRISTRYFAYLADLLIVISISSLLASAMGILPVIFQVITKFSLGLHPLVSASEYGAFYMSVLIFLLVSFAYFLSEVVVSGTIGGKILGVRTVVVRPESGNMPRGTLGFQVIRAVIKAFPFAHLVNSLGAFSDNSGRTFIDRIASTMVVSRKEEPTWGRLIAASMVVYYLPLLSLVLMMAYSGTLAVVSPPSRSDAFTYDPNMGTFYQILNSNLSLDIYRISLGGLVVMILDILQVSSAAFTSSILLGGALTKSPLFLVYGLFPHFFLESMGYVFGIISAFYFMRMIVESVRGYFLSKDTKYLIGIISGNLYRVGIYLAVSVLLLIVAAYVETYVTSYLLYHYYYTGTILFVR